MGTIETQLADDLKVAMRNGDTVRRDVIRYLRASLKNAQIARVQVDEGATEADATRAAERDQPLSDAEELAVLQRQVKQRQDSIAQFEGAGRQDLVSRESAQLAILQSYLPTGLSGEEVEALVRETIVETGATGPRDMKLVMPRAIERAAGRADNRTISDAVRQLLAEGGR